MKNYIKNKTALITGATSGIGEQLALDLAIYNINLVLIARNYEKLKSLKKQIKKSNKRIKVKIYTLDVRKKSKVKKILEKLVKKTTIDILVNNAGLALGLSDIDKGDISQWDDMIDTNIKGLLYVSRAIIPNMRTLKTAHIINIGSVAGKYAYPNGNVYCATKSAVHALGEGMNADLYGTNVKVTTIAPGAVETNFSNVRFNNDKEKINATYEGFTPLNAKDISNTIISILNTPKHLNIQYVDIMPTAQRNPYLLDRNN